MKEKNDKSHAFQYIGGSHKTSVIRTQGYNRHANKKEIDEMIQEQYDKVGSDGHNTIEVINK